MIAAEAASLPRRAIFLPLHTRNNNFIFFTSSLLHPADPAFIAITLTSPAGNALTSLDSAKEPPAPQCASCDRTGDPSGRDQDHWLEEGNHSILRTKPHRAQKYGSNVAHRSNNRMKLIRTIKMSQTLATCNTPWAMLKGVRGKG
ncbi:hypothetical protein SMMN14_05723 [Sphaerulina musiva]